MSTVAISKFITELALHFPPKHARPELETAWLKSMADALRGTASGVLEEAARHIIQTRKYTSFPLPAECRNACMDIAERQRLRADAGALPHPALGASAGAEWSSERVKLAYDLIKSALGKEAVKDRWIGPLWSFCRKNQRLPAGREIEACKREAKEFDAAYARCVTGAAGPMSGVLMQLGDSMLAKRLKLEAEVMGRAV